jgi:hypothetical protein
MRAIAIRVVITLTVPLAIWWPPAARGQDAIRQLLAASGVDDEALASVPNAAPLTAEQENVIRKVLYRLRRLSPEQLERESVEVASVLLPAASDAQAARGAVLQAAGRAVELQRVGPRTADDQHGALFRCRLELDDTGTSAVVWTDRVPSAWLGQALDERASVRGVLTRIDSDRAGRDTLILLARGIAWHPDREGLVDATIGRLCLGTLGVDVSLLDEVVHDLPLTSEDRPAFYGILAAVERLNTNDLVRIAGKSLAAYAEPWQQKAESSIRRGTDDQRELLARAVVDAAREGKFSVAPLFLDASRQTGQLLLLEGIARRAVRIQVSRPLHGANGGRSSPGDAYEYFELEVFTADSQNLPLVVCLPSLPPEFPLGDSIQERVRLAGFFFKKWRYDSRFPLQRAPGPLRFQTASAPLVIAAEPVWPLPASPGVTRDWGWLAGGIFLVLVLFSCLGLWLWSREDRRFRRRIAASVQALDLPSSEEMP